MIMNTKLKFYLRNIIAQIKKGKQDTNLVYPFICIIYKNRIQRASVNREFSFSD